MLEKAPKNLSKVITSLVNDRQQKVAMVVAKVVREYETRGAHVESIVVGARIAKLVERGDLVGIGDVSNWRFSEVRMPDRTLKRTARPAGRGGKKQAAN
jgi:hypothetical protein